MPGLASQWEQTADIADIARIAEAADRLGFEYLTCSEHVAVPEADALVRGVTYWDPLATLGYLAARTSRIRLATSVVVLGYHHPLAIAKRYGTLDRISGGRLILGLGVGSLKPEFKLLGASWSDRGARADDAVRALRASLSLPSPSYHGAYAHFDSFIVDPCAVQSRVPIWVGGHTSRSLRRAVQHGDGWMPFGLNRLQISTMLARQDLPPGFEVVLPTKSLDPTGEPAGTRRQLAHLHDVGASAITCSIAATSADHYCEQLAALMATNVAMTVGSE